MLSHKKSNASERLRRAKSSASMSSRGHNNVRPQGTDAETASQDAVIAASQAFERANERYRESITKEFLSQCNRRKSTDLRSSQPYPNLSRQPSIRFAGTAAVNRRQSIRSRGTQHRRNESTMTGTTTRSSIDRAASILEASANLDELHTPEDDVASTPSSYRRVRKSKSFFSTRGSDPIMSSVGILEKLGKTGDSNTVGLEPSEKQLRTPKSTSFLRGGFDHLTPSIRRRNDEAIAAARDTYLQQVQQQQLRKTPSFSLTPGAVKRQKAFRKTVRTSNKINGTAVSSPNQSGTSVERGIGAKARRLSFNLANGFKRVFRKNTDAEDAIPLQHVEAARPHFGNLGDTRSSNIHSSYDDRFYEDDTLSQCQSRVPSLRVVPLASDPYTRDVSRASFHSEDGQSNGNSRVTSWTNSTAANTLATREAIQQKRLSIIREYSTPRRSATIKGVRNAGSGNDIISNSEEHDQSPGPIDSQRVYSALQKRINGPLISTNSCDAVGGPEKIYSGSLAGFGQVVSAWSNNNLQYMSSEVVEKLDNNKRRIDSTCDILNAETYETNRINQDDVFSAQDPASDDFSQRESVQDNCKDDKSVRTISRLSSISNAVPEPLLHDDLIRQLTPQEIANRYEAIKPSQARVLREAKSSFFPYSPGNRFKSPSPYRKAVDASLKAGDEDELHNRIGSDLGISQRSISRDDSVTESASIYSRTTSGNDPIHSNINEPVYSAEGPLGSAVIITDRKEPVLRHGGKSFTFLDGLSRAKTSSLSENNRSANPNHKSLNLNPALQGHTREWAQIDDNDVEIGATTPRKRDFGPMLAVPPTALRTKFSLAQFKQDDLSTRPSSVALAGSKEDNHNSFDPESARLASVLQDFNLNINQGKSNVRNSDGELSKDVTGPSSRRKDCKIIEKSKFTEHLEEQTEPRLGRARSTATMKLRFAHDPDSNFKSVNNENAQSSVSDSSRLSTTKPNDVFEDHYDKLYGTGRSRTSTPKFANSRMVDIFLSSRRRRMKMSEDSGTIAFV